MQEPINGLLANVYISLSLSACSCAQTSKLLFVLPMYEELQPGQVNSYTTFDWLNGGVLSLALVKKHVFSYGLRLTHCSFHVGSLHVRKCFLFSVESIQIPILFMCGHLAGSKKIIFIRMSWRKRMKIILWSSPLFGCQHSGRRDISEAYV